MPVFFSFNYTNLIVQYIVSVSAFLGPTLSMSVIHVAIYTVVVGRLFLPITDGILLYTHATTYLSILLLAGIGILFGYFDKTVLHIPSG